MNVGLQRLIKLTRRFLQVKKKSFDIDENFRFRPSLELEGLGLLPGEDFSENGNSLKLQVEDMSLKPSPSKVSVGG